VAGRGKAGNRSVDPAKACSLWRIRSMIQTNNQRPLPAVNLPSQGDESIEVDGSCYLVDLLEEAAKDDVCEGLTETLRSLKVAHQVRREL